LSFAASFGSLLSGDSFDSSIEFLPEKRGHNHPESYETGFLSNEYANCSAETTKMFFVSKQHKCNLFSWSLFREVSLLAEV
jgi:hypothetical protein